MFAGDNENQVLLALPPLYHPLPQSLGRLPILLPVTFHSVSVIVVQFIFMFGTYFRLLPPFFAPQ